MVAYELDLVALFAFADPEYSNKRRMRAFGGIHHDTTFGHALLFLGLLTVYMEPWDKKGYHCAFRNADLISRSPGSGKLVARTSLSGFTMRRHGSTAKPRTKERRAHRQSLMTNCLMTG